MRFPYLEDFSITGAPTTKYNCIAWTLGKTDTWEWPGYSISDFDNLYGQYGYRVVLKDGAQIALFVKEDIAMHGAVRISANTWESKLGELHRITHRLEDIEDDFYGKAERFYSK
jgi:hypothetical protein